MAQPDFRSDPRGALAIGQTIFVVFLLSLSFSARGKTCGEMENYDYSTAMCMPRAMAGMPMRMLMLHGNGFAVQDFESGARGANALSGPNMIMADLGTSLGPRHYLNLDLMATGELWTFPRSGYPELLQVGEAQADGTPFLDAQHPHSSPIMGLTLSDSLSFGEGMDHFKYFFAPRGQSTDGPVAFMHRPTGTINPDPPLGHHVGQDVGHITSTVLGAEWRRGETQLEVSAFHGREPQPTKVDLPLGKIDSFAARWTEQWTKTKYSMLSVAYVQDPESDASEIRDLWRTSASLYLDVDQEFHNALIYGLIHNYDGAPSLQSFGEEFWLERDAVNYFGRIEYLQRTLGELAISESAETRWIEALSLGWSYRIVRGGSFHLNAGVSVTCDFLPGDLKDAYGSLPLSGRIFIQATGMNMWNL